MSKTKIMNGIVGKLFYNPKGPVTVQVYEAASTTGLVLPEVPTARVFVPLAEIGEWQIGKRVTITVEVE
jgi:hypothetical protein